MYFARIALVLASPTIVVAQSFADVTAASGMQGTAPADLRYGSGMATGDFDGDGDLDVVLTGTLGQPIRYFRNEGAMTFSDRSPQSGLGTSGSVRGVGTADIDNDGDLDLVIGNWHGAVQLFVNDGGGVFVDEAVSRGLVHVASNWSMSFGDYDRDGWLDLYVGNRYLAGQPGFPEANILYRNTGDGHFVDVTVAAGVGHLGATFVAPFVDYDEDGWPDIVCVNDKGPAILPNELYRNLGDGTFVPFGTSTGANDAIDGMGLDFVDAFRDGGIDYVCSDIPPNHLFNVWYPALQKYIDDAVPLGVTGGHTGWAVQFLDVDNDGWQDLHVVHEDGPNHLYRNPAMPHASSVPWSELGDALAPTWIQTTAIAADFDEDGRVDLLHRFEHAFGPQPPGLALHRNVLPAGHWLRVHTVGTVSNAQGIGARVDVITAGTRQRQHVRNGIGFLSSNDTRVHFGVGDASAVDVEVWWPSGQTQRIEGVPVDQTLTIVEPRMRLLGDAALGTDCAIELSVPADDGMQYAILVATNDAPGTPLGDGRVLPIVIDAVTEAAMGPGNGLIDGHLGVLQGGVGSAVLSVPDQSWIVGLTLFATGITYEPGAWPIGTTFPRAMPITFVP